MEVQNAGHRHGRDGESLPTLDNLVILAEMLGVSIDEVIVTKRF